MTEQIEFLRAANTLIETRGLKEAIVHSAEQVRTFAERGSDHGVGHWISVLNAIHYLSNHDMPEGASIN